MLGRFRSQNIPICLRLSACRSFLLESGHSIAIRLIVTLDNPFRIDITAEYLLDNAEFPRLARFRTVHSFLPRSRRDL